jgi:hypothetical protein
MPCPFHQFRTVTENTPFSKDDFLYPSSHYRGEFTPENLAFDANLQEFAQRVSLICGLESGGKVSPDEAYDQIKDLWKQLKQSKKNLLDEPRPPQPEIPED